MLRLLGVIHALNIIISASCNWDLIQILLLICIVLSISLLNLFLRLAVLDGCLLLHLFAHSLLF